MQSHTAFNVYVAKRCFYVACLNSCMFRSLFRPSSGCTLSIYKANLLYNKKVLLILVIQSTQRGGLI